MAFDDLVVVANRDSDQVVLFFIGRRGNMHQVGSPFPTGIDPHVIAVSSQGVVAVANSTSNDLTVFDLDRHGNMFLADEAFSVGNSPKALSFGTHGHALFVATRSTEFGVVEDQIQAYDVGGGGQLHAAGSTDAGVFLTDLEARHGALFAVTASAAGQNEVRAYRRRRTDLTLGATLETPGAPPSFKQLSTARGHHGVDRVLFVSEFQAGRVRSIEYREH